MATAQKVEKLARESEKAQLDGDTKLGMEEAKDIAKADQEDHDRRAAQQTQATAIDETTKELLKKAAVSGADTATVASLGRQAAVNLLSSNGSWTRQAAEAALSGTDEDVATWVRTDYEKALHQDDREKVLYLAKIGGPRLAEAAQKVLEGDDAGVEEFLSHGVYDVQAEDYRVQVAKLMNGAGKAVKSAGSAALDDGSAKALYEFLLNGYRTALEEDDRVETVTVMHDGGPNVQAAAQVAMNGPTWMQHEFVTHVQYKSAQSDQDTATHVASVRALIATAARISALANQNAAEASEAAANAHDKAKEAGVWADKAHTSAAQAKGYANEARDRAREADESAAEAAGSAQKAKNAAATARQADRQANYSANQAATSADQAMASAENARASATDASRSATAAGKDAKDAAQAASDANTIAAQKRRQEQAAAAAKAAEQARENAKKGTDPAADAGNDTINLPYKASDGKDTARLWAERAGRVSSWVGIVGAFSLAIPIVGEVSAPILGEASVALGVVSAGLYAYADGFNSSGFVQAVAGIALGKIGSGISSIIKEAAPRAVISTGSRIVHESISGIIGLFG